MRKRLITFFSLIIGAALAAPVFQVVEVRLVAEGDSPFRMPNFHYLVFAAAPVAHAADCSLNDRLQALQNIQDRPLPNYDDNVRAELAARKDVLNAVIDCAIGEIGPLKASVAAVQSDDRDVQAAQARLLSGFDEAAGYYQFQKSRVNDMGIEGTKELSRGIREWRAATYEPLSQLATNFVIWTKNQIILGSAENRFGQIKRTLKLLKLTDDQAIQDLLNKADGDVKRADDANNAARGALLRFGAPDDSSRAIRDTLNFLADAYQAFFDIATALEKTR